MRHLLAHLLLAVGALPAQNLVTNGDFAQNLTGWTQMGFAASPLVESFDTTGLGASAAFACSPGNNSSPPLTLEQTILVLPNIPHEVFADIATAPPGFNNDGGQVQVYIGGTPVTSHLFGVVQGVVKRQTLCARFVDPVGGLMPLRFEFVRTFSALFGRTPRVYLDNVSAVVALGPSFCIRGDRIVGAPVSLEVAGSPNARFSVLVAGGVRAQPIVIPGILGTFALDGTAVQLLSGTLDGNGDFKLPFTLPNDPSLHGVPLWFQAVQLSNGTAAIGPEHDFALHV